MSYNDDDIESFTITSKSEIAFYLRQLINDQEPLTVMFDEGRETMLTMALNLDEEKSQLILDWGGSETTNQRLLKAPSASFVANPLGVRNLFHTSSVKAVSYQGREAFATGVPAKYIRLQRREYFRLTLPLLNRPTCRLSLPEALGGKACSLSVVDICVGGIGLEFKGKLLPEHGLMLPKAAIDLGKFGVINTDLIVHFAGQQTRGAEVVTRIGCEFANLGRGADMTVQRFITQIQRDQRARLG